MEKKMKIQAIREASTKNKWKFMARDLGINIGIYIDRVVNQVDLPEEITIILKTR